MPLIVCIVFALHKFKLKKICILLLHYEKKKRKKKLSETQQYVNKTFKFLKIDCVYNGIE